MSSSLLLLFVFFSYVNRFFFAFFSICWYSGFQIGRTIFILWAYHSTSDVQPGQFAFHSARGFQQVTLIPAATLTPTTNPATTPTRGGFLNHPQPQLTAASLNFFRFTLTVELVSSMFVFSVKISVW